MTAVAESWWFKMSRAVPGTRIEPGDTLKAEALPPKGGDHAFQQIGSGWFFGLVAKSRTRGLCLRLLRDDGAFDPLRRSSRIEPSDSVLVVTGLTRRDP